MQTTIFAPATALATALALAAALTTGTAMAQPAAGYTGPSNVPVVTVKQLLDSGKDDQHARLQGRIVSHDGGEHYTFADDSGRMTVEIDAKDFPKGESISAEQRVELIGEFEKSWTKSEFEVDQVRVLK